MDKKCIIKNIFKDVFQSNPADFLHKFVTVNETWVYNYTLDKRAIEKVYISGELATKKTRTVLSAGKIIATVF